jgi:hypothetical protein
MEENSCIALTFMGSLLVGTCTIRTGLPVNFSSTLSSTLPQSFDVRMTGDRSAVGFG